MAMREIFAGMPWWVKWVAVPVIALVVFGGLIASVVGFVIGLLFKAAGVRRPGRRTHLRRTEVHVVLGSSSDW